MTVQNQDHYYDVLRQDCWDNASHAFGTQYIYSNRSRLLSKLLKANNFLGIIVPVMVGGIVTSYSISDENLQIIIWTAATFSLIQLFLSVMSLSYKWDDSYAYYLESCTDNSTISNDYMQLAKFPPKKILEFKAKKQFIDLKYDIRSSGDSKYPLSEKEKRRGMKFSLRNFRRSCAGCGIVPTDMNSTDCGVCGNFNFLT